MAQAAQLRRRNEQRKPHRAKETRSVAVFDGAFAFFDRVVESGSACRTLSYASSCVLHRVRTRCSLLLQSSAMAPMRLPPALLAVLVGLAFATLELPLPVRALGVVLTMFICTLLAPGEPLVPSVQPPAPRTDTGLASPPGSPGKRSLPSRTGSPGSRAASPWGRARSPPRTIPNALDAAYYTASRPASRAGTTFRTATGSPPPPAPVLSATDAERAASDAEHAAVLLEREAQIKAAAFAAASSALAEQRAGRIPVPSVEPVSAVPSDSPTLSYASPQPAARECDGASSQTQSTDDEEVSESESDGGNVEGGAAADTAHAPVVEEVSRRAPEQAQARLADEQRAKGGWGVAEGTPSSTTPISPPRGRSVDVPATGASPTRRFRFGSPFRSRSPSPRARARREEQQRAKAARAEAKAQEKAAKKAAKAAAKDAAKAVRAAGRAQSAGASPRRFTSPFKRFTSPPRTQPAAAATAIPAVTSIAAPPPNPGAAAAAAGNLQRQPPRAAPATAPPALQRRDRFSDEDSFTDDSSIASYRY